MARIRSIKPDFWTSEQVLNCTRDTRLFFIGLWNFCDDGGVHPLQPKNLRVKVFPADEDLTSASILGYIKELSANGLISIFEHEGAEYIHVCGWSKHQRIDKPRPTQIKPPKPRARISDNSKNNPGNIREASATDGWKERGMDGSIDPIQPHNSGQSSAGSGSAEAPPARTPPADDRVEVDVGGGVIFAIAANGLCEHVQSPRDAEIPVLTPARAVELRAAALNPAVEHQPKPLKAKGEQATTPETDTAPVGDGRPQPDSGAPADPQVKTHQDTAAIGRPPKNLATNSDDDMPDLPTELARQLVKTA